MNFLDALTRSLGTQLEKPQESELLKRDASRGKPVLQLSRLPRTLDARSYRDARSDANPRGDLLPLFEFRQLVDPVPSFSRDYHASTMSLEKSYGMILEGASAAASSSLVRSVLSDAKLQFAKETFESSAGTPGVWRPVYAVPGDWCEASAASRFRDLEVNLEARPGDDSPFATIGSAAPLQLAADPGAVQASPTTSRIRAVRMKYLLVELRRSWLNSLLFELDDWHFGAESAGFCSSGRLDENPGMLPLIPTGLLLAQGVEVDADWSREDQTLLDRARGGRGSAFLGPFSMHEGASGTALQVVGWTSSLVPFAPKANGRAAGWVTLRNQGAFTARFTLSWRVGGEQSTRTSHRILALASDSIRLPGAAREIGVKIEIMTAPFPETWRIVGQHAFPEPVQKTYEVSGVTWKPHLSEVP